MSNGEASALDRLRGGDLARWPSIKAAAAKSNERLSHIAALTSDILPGGEGSLIVFGSLARSEFTSGSDLDWTVLIDGRANSDHNRDVHRVREIFEEHKVNPPGSSGTFGTLSFSHDLIHTIGGDEDTNKNMTRRLLLLLESFPIDISESALVYERLIKAVVYRYVKEDASFISGKRSRSRVPRFLLNDVVRFWRTMAVDYASKYRQRGADGWALRNIKLRMSRKLLFLTGIFMCLSWSLQETRDGDFSEDLLMEHLITWVNKSPLEAVASIVEAHQPALADEIFGSYDDFLAVLDDETDRNILKKLPPGEAFDNEVFLRAREIATRFDGALRKLLFCSDDRITALTHKYGVF